MRIIAIASVCLLAGLAGCATQTAAQQQANAACLEDLSGNVLMVGVSATTAAGNAGQKAASAAQTVVVSAATDPNCQKAAALAAASLAGSAAPAATAAPATAPAAASSH